MAGEVNQPSTQEETVDPDLVMTTHLEDRRTIEKIGGKEAILTMTENTEGREVTVETKETTTTEAAGRGSEDTARGVSVSEGLL